MNLISQYKGLRKEMYVLFFGRTVTSMGSIAGSMLTFIMSNKLGMNPALIADVMIIMGFIQLPCIMLGGKLADKYDKRKLIIVCDLISVSCFVAMFFMQMSFAVLGLFFVAGLFAKMEWSAYDSLVADFSKVEERDRAYSLNYLGSNIGIVLAPALGGLLFENNLNLAFLITGIATLSSTALIFFCIKNTTPEVGGIEEKQENVSLSKVLSSRKLILFYIICAMLARGVYTQFNFLLPLNLEQLYSAEGAKYFGFLTSLNGVIVILGTPILTRVFSKTRELSKVIIGEMLIVFSLSMYIFIQGIPPLYFVSMGLFTLGEIMVVLGAKPYLTKRIPASHRGRINGFELVLCVFFEGVMIKTLGGMAEVTTMSNVWIVVTLVGALAISLYLVLKRLDKKKYARLYLPKIDADALRAEDLEDKKENNGR